VCCTRARRCASKCSLLAAMALPTGHCAVLCSAVRMSCVQRAVVLYCLLRLGCPWTFLVCTNRGSQWARWEHCRVPSNRLERSRCERPLSLLTGHCAVLSCGLAVHSKCVLPHHSNSAGARRLLSALSLIMSGAKHTPFMIRSLWLIHGCYSFAHSPTPVLLR